MDIRTEPGFGNRISHVHRYYNGTTSFRLTPEDWGDDEDEMVCGAFRNRSVTFSYDSIVAVVKPNGYDEGENPFMLIVKAFPPGTNLTSPYGNSALYPPQINQDVFELKSIE
jgi:hypothetical protein